MLDAIIFTPRLDQGLQLARGQRSVEKANRAGLFDTGVDALDERIVHAQNGDWKAIGVCDDDGGRSTIELR